MWNFFCRDILRRKKTQSSSVFQGYAGLGKPRIWISDEYNWSIWLKKTNFKVMLDWASQEFEFQMNNWSIWFKKNGEIQKNEDFPWGKLGNIAKIAKIQAQNSNSNLKKPKIRCFKLLRGLWYCQNVVPVFPGLSNGVGFMQIGPAEHEKKIWGP